MSVVTGTSIGGGMGTLDARVNRRFLAKESFAVSRKRNNYTRQERAFIKNESYLKLAYEAWADLTDMEKLGWEDAALMCDSTGYNLFVKDTIYRMMNELAGTATPSTSHQYKIGHVFVPEGAGNVLLRQAGGYTPSGDVEMSLYYKADLRADNGMPNFCKVRFRYYALVGEVTTPQTEEITLTLSTGWDSAYHAFTVISGATGGWEAEVEFNNVEGDLWFDNFYMTDGLEVSTRDKYCERTEKYWHALNPPDGVLIETIYPDE